MSLPFILLILHTLIDSISLKNQRPPIMVKPLNRVSDELKANALGNEKLLISVKTITLHGIPIIYGLFLCSFFVFGVFF